VGALALRHGQGQGTGAGDLEALMSQTKRVAAVLHVPAVHLDQLRPVRDVALGLPEHPLVLGPHVAEEALDGESRQER
jgi:hypothetical protein